MPTTFTPKRVVNGLPLTEHHRHEYEFGGVLFVKPMNFWHAQAPDGTMTGPYFTLDNAVTVARANGWIAPVDTCRWCSGHGFHNTPGSYFDLQVCQECQGEGIDPQQPATYVGVTA